MNIVLTTQDFPPSRTDGIARYNHSMAVELASRGHTVHVVTKQTDVEYKDPPFNIHYYDPAKYFWEVSNIPPVNTMLSLGKAVYEKVYEISKTQRIDVIVSPLWDVEGYALTLNKIAPVIATIMTPFKKFVEFNPGVLNDSEAEVIFELERQFLYNSNAIMSISDNIWETINTKYGLEERIISNKIIRTVHLGVDDSFMEGVDRFEPQEGSSDSKTRLLFVGRLETRKGVDVLLRALPPLMSSNPNLFIDIVGRQGAYEPDYEGDFRTEHKGEKWLDRVIFQGYVSDEDLMQMYHDTDVFVAPSRYESFGIILLEAMAFSKPVVATRVGGMMEIVKDGENGFLFENDDHKDLQSKLEKLVNSKKLRKEIGIKGREMLEDYFTSERMIDDFEKLAQEVINKANSISIRAEEMIPVTETNPDLYRWNQEADNSKVRSFNYLKRLFSNIPFLRRLLHKLRKHLV